MTNQQEKTQLERDLAELTQLVAAVKSLPEGRVKKQAKKLAYRICCDIAISEDTNIFIIAKTVGIDWNTSIFIDE